MNVTLIDRPPVTIACMRHTGLYGAPVAEFWKHTVVPWLSANNLLGVSRYGIGHDDPCIVAPDQCRYDAGAEVDENFVASGAAFKATLPGGRHAVLAFRGTVAELGAAWGALIDDWLPASGLRIKASPFEHYPAGSFADPLTGVFECEICIPVTAQSTADVPALDR